MNTTQIIRNRINSLDTIVKQTNYYSYDLYDGLTAHWMKSKNFTKNSLILRIWTQFVNYSPINFRKILRIKPTPHPKILSDFLSAYSQLYLHNEDNDLLDEIENLSKKILDLKFNTQNGYGWGLGFPVVTRYVVTNEFTPNSYTTINVIHAFLDAYKASKKELFLDFAEKGMEFEEKYMGFQDFGDYISWNYYQGVSSEIFNINGLMLGLCARMYSLTHKEKYLEWAIKIYHGLKKGQNLDGSWFYSSDEKGKWIDGFHTGFILEGLCRACNARIIPNDDVVLVDGVKFYLSNLFDNSGFPLYYPYKKYPIDAQNCAQTIQTLFFLVKTNLVKTEKVIKTFEMIDKSLWNKKGYYNYRKTKFFTYITPMHRWSSGPMYLALSNLIGILG